MWPWESLLTCRSSVFNWQWDTYLSLMLKNWIPSPGVLTFPPSPLCHWHYSPALFLTLCIHYLSTGMEVFSCMFAKLMSSLYSSKYLLREEIWTSDSFLHVLRELVWLQSWLSSSKPCSLLQGLSFSFQNFYGCTQPSVNFNSRGIGCPLLFPVDSANTWWTHIPPDHTYAHKINIWKENGNRLPKFEKE